MKRRLPRPRAVAAALPPLALTFAFLALWELAVRLDILSGLYFPEPTLIWRALLKVARSGELWAHIRATLVRVSWALLLGCVPGLILGLLMGWSSRFRALVDPVIAAIHPLPKVALLPLVMVVLGVGDKSLVAVAAAAAFFPVLINTMTGVQGIHPLYFEVARSYGASRLKVLRRVLLPGSLPATLTGIRLAANVTLLVSVAVEMMSAQKGLGAMIWMAWNTMRTENIYVCLVVITTLGVLFNAALGQITAFLVPWQSEHTNRKMA